MTSTRESTVGGLAAEFQQRLRRSLTGQYHTAAKHRRFDNWVVTSAAVSGLTGTVLAVIVAAVEAPAVELRIAAAVGIGLASTLEVVRLRVGGRQEEGRRHTSGAIYGDLKRQVEVIWARFHSGLLDEASAFSALDALRAEMKQAAAAAPPVPRKIWDEVKRDLKSKPDWSPGQMK